MLSSVEVVVIFTFFGHPCFATASTNHLNCVSTKTLFAVVSYMMSIAVANCSSSSSDSDRRILRVSTRNEPKVVEGSLPGNNKTAFEERTNLLLFREGYLTKC